jgi:hypothetical protein
VNFTVRVLGALLAALILVLALAFWVDSRVR